MQPGATATIVTGGRAVSYVVTGVREYAKTALPADVFTQTAAPRLVMITCGGPFDPATGHYADNVVVYAVPAG